MHENNLTTETVSAERYSQQSGKQSELQLGKHYFCYLESRPIEQGRNALVVVDLQNAVTPFDLLPAPASIRTRAQEYGGGSYLLTDEFIFYVLDEDQNIYRYSFAEQTHQAITQVNSSEKIQYRFADFYFDTKRNRLICACEEFNSSHHPEAFIAAINNEPNASFDRLIYGNDFYSNPSLDPAGNQLCYLTWNHPQMPWDGTQCYCADLNSSGDVIENRLIAGSLTESIFQPQWSPSGKLYFVSDRTNWWNIYSFSENKVSPVISMAAEFATPQWVFAMSTYKFLDEDHILCCYSENGSWQLGVIDLKSLSLKTIAGTTNRQTHQQIFRDISCITTDHGVAFFLAGTAKSPQTIWRFNSVESVSEWQPKTTGLLDENISTAQAFSFTTADGERAHGFYYPPTQPNRANSYKPPLILVCHGGPTGATETSFSLKIQFWTSRGFAVADINYRGSTGYGRDYRNALRGKWGVADVQDVCFAAQYLIDNGLADSEKIFIRGGSAGGFTVLAALAFAEDIIGKTLFRAGASLYGIGDLTALAEDTHKFEARYMDQLVGEFPRDQAIYHERSPVRHLNQFKCPVIFLQGLKDKVVPPQQAESMYFALKEKNIKTELVVFPDEGHGFRLAENVKIAIEKELAFYESVLSQNSLGSRH